MTEQTPPQHLLGGLNVAFICAGSGDTGPLQKIKAGLEEKGVNVVILAARKGPLAGAEGDPGLEVSLDVDKADPEALDGVLLVSTDDSAQPLRAVPKLQEFVAAFAAQDKPLGFLGGAAEMAGPRNPLVARSDAEVDHLIACLLDGLAQRRRESVTIGNDTSSAVGEDG